MDSIVIIDSDEKMIRFLMEEIDWIELDCRVAAVEESAEAGMERIRSLQPSLVVTEIALPGISGLEMIRRLQTESYDGDFIIITERKIFEEARQAVQIGVRGFLTKPLEANEMKETFRRILGRKGGNGCELLGGSGQESYIVRQSLHYIDAHLYGDLSLTAVCGAMGVSPSYFSRLFRQETGTGFLKYVRVKKLEQAKMLLQNPGYKVYQVAEMLGYHNYSYFYQIFKEQFGFSPGERR